MNITEQEKLKAKAQEFFNNIDPIRRAEAEAMYQGFKARMMYEVRVAGGSHQGVVYGHLESSN